MKVKTDVDFEIEDDLDRARTEVNIHARKWIRRAKNAAELQVIQQHKKGLLRGKTPKALTSKDVVIRDAD